VTQGNRRAEAAGGALDHDADRFPKAVEGLRRIVQTADLPEYGVSHIHIQFQANGEGVYRIRRARSDDVDGGYLPPPG